MRNISLHIPSIISEKTLLAPIIAHAIWNIAGALFLGGVSLAEDYPHLLTVNASPNVIFSGGAYKIEASIVTTILNLILLVLFFIKYMKTTDGSKNNQQVRLFDADDIIIK